jgi:hypothetical protein
MSTTPPLPPAGWFDDPTDPTIQRYWDGVAWTQHTAPKSAAAPTLPAQEVAAPALALDPYTGKPIQQPGVAPVVPAPKKGLSKTAIVFISIGGALLLLTMTGMIAGAISGGRTASSTVSTPIAVTTPTATPPAEPEATAEAPAPPAKTTPPAPVVDAAAFTAAAGKHVDDINKDLDDMIVTLDEGGTWRLLSNSAELAFNLGQLQALEVPENISVEWAAGLTALETSMDTMSTAVGEQRYEDVRTDIESTRAAAEALREIASRAA